MLRKCSLEKVLKSYLSLVMIDIIVWYVHSIEFYSIPRCENFCFMPAIHGVDEKQR